MKKLIQWLTLTLTFALVFSGLSVQAQAAVKKKKAVQAAQKQESTKPTGHTFFAVTGGSLNQLLARKHPKDGAGVFDIQVKQLPKQSAVLSIMAYDVDEERGESTVVFVNEQRVGTLSGTNNTWNSNVFTLDPKIIKVGANTIRLLIQDSSKTGTINWSLRVSGGQLLIDGGSGDAGYIVDVGIQIKKAQKMADLTIPIQGIKKGQFKLESTIVHPNGNALYSMQEEFKLEEGQKVQRIQMTEFDPGLPSGNYKVVSNLYYLEKGTWVQQNFKDKSASHRENAAPILIAEPVSSGFTTEGGGKHSFKVTLVTQPIKTVTINVESLDTSEMTVSPAQLVFTPENWKTPLTITATGVDDFRDDGDQKVTIKLHPAISEDEAYTGMDTPDITLTNQDDDTSGFLISTVNQDTSEDGESAEFHVRLTAQPSSPVKIKVDSSDLKEVLPAQKELVFTPKNWDKEQIVTLKGVDDFLADGAKSVIIRLGEANSTDKNYAKLNPKDVIVTNLDNERPASLETTQVSGPTSEDGGTSSFSVQLPYMPLKKVTLTIKSSDTKEFKISPTIVTFTADNWNKPQVVTLTGVDDNVDDGDKKVQVIFEKMVSQDETYNNLKIKALEVTNIDNDKSGFIGTFITQDTTESGGTAQFSVRLTTSPVQDVTLGVSSSDLTEATVSAKELVFTATNWNKPQVVTVTGVDDDEHDQNQALKILITKATSADKGYQGLKPDDVDLINLDDDRNQVIVTQIRGNTNERGTTSDFRVKLGSKPSADVKISLDSKNTAEVTVSAKELVFTDKNWSLFQTVTVTGVDDHKQDGDQKTEVAFANVQSTDKNYEGQTLAALAVVNEDDDKSALIVTNISGDTKENGQVATFSVSLSTIPTADVVLNLKSGDTKENTLSTGQITLTSKNWNQPQIVTVTGVDDHDIDGNKTTTITLANLESADKDYQAQKNAVIKVKNIDDDVAAVLVSQASLATMENGSQADFSVALASKPKANVSIKLNSSNTAEVKVAQKSIVFTPANWDKAQTIQVNGVDDRKIDGDQKVTVVLGSANSKDRSYNKLKPKSVVVVNQDDDQSGLVVTNISGQTSELGVQSSFSIQLKSQPKASVSFSVESSDTTEVTVSKKSLTFTPKNWQTAQTLTLTGVDDTEDDGDQEVSIVLSESTSKDADYQGLKGKTLKLTNIDNDTADIVVRNLSGDTDEFGQKANFGLRLASKPVANVTLTVSSSDTKEVTLSPEKIEFTPENWNAFQTIHLKGVDDPVIDGDKAVSIVTAAAVSEDKKYQGLQPGAVKFKNLDNDKAELVVTALTSNTSESGTTASFMVKLTSQPTSNVTLGVTSSNIGEITVSTASLVFDPTNWNKFQVVTLKGQNDQFDDGDQLTIIQLAKSVSEDVNYNGLDPADLRVFNVDDDDAGINVFQ